MRQFRSQFPTAWVDRANGETVRTVERTAPLPEAIEFAVMKIRSGPGVITKMKTVGMKTISVVSSINIRIAI